MNKIELKLAYLLFPILGCGITMLPHEATYSVDQEADFKLNAKESLEQNALHDRYVRARHKATIYLLWSIIEVTGQHLYQSNVNRLIERRFM